MAYIAPNSTVDFYPSLGITNTDKLFFSTLETKNHYFDTIDKIYSIGALSYVSKEKGIIRVEIPFSDAYRIGYMRYKNTNFENFYFYAFVDKVEYINNELCSIYFTIDSIMTYLGVFELRECFIRRQHTLSDEIGANIADEGIYFGEYITESVEKTNLFDTYRIAVFTSETTTGDLAGRMNGGIYDGTAVQTFSSAESANEFLAGFKEKYDNILAIFMLPTFFLIADSTTSPINYLIEITKPYTDINGYVPRNKKLFCYPYKTLTVTNSEGESVDLMYEFFNTLPDATSTGKCSFDVYGIASTAPVCALVPKNYRGNSENYNEMIQMTKFPMCSWNVDGYKAYMAQYMTNLPVRATESVISSAASLAGGKFASTAVTAASEVTSLIGEAVNASTLPNISRGTQGSDIMAGLAEKDFYFNKQCITKNYAMMLDSFFDMFGYKINQHGKPNMHARRTWTYIETQNCVVSGNVPSDNAREIENAFNSGIRFWATTHNNIGNYNLPNEPI